MDIDSPGLGGAERTEGGLGMGANTPSDPAGMNPWECLRGLPSRRSALCDRWEAARVELRAVHAKVTEMHEIYLTAVENEMGLRDDEMIYHIHHWKNLQQIRRMERQCEDNVDELESELIVFEQEVRKLEEALVNISYDCKGQPSWEDRVRWAEGAVRRLSQIREEGYVQGDFTLSNNVVHGANYAKTGPYPWSGWEVRQDAMNPEADKASPLSKILRGYLEQLGETALSLEKLADSYIDSALNSGVDVWLEPHDCASSNPTKSRRGRGQRKDKAYWNWRAKSSDLGLFERDVLINGKNGNLTIPGFVRLDQASDVPFCISEKYLKQQGRGHEIDSNLTDEERRSINDDQMPISGIIRNLPFRVSGTSRVFFQDFVVTKALDDVADMVIGWQFMWQEFKLLFDNVRENVLGWIKGKVSTFTEKIATVSSELRRRAENVASGVASLLPPPYSLVDVRRDSTALSRICLV